MSLARKRGVLLGFLLLFALWPLAHRWLVERFETDPWLLHGWAMYCVPRVQPEVQLFGVSDGLRTRLDPRADPRLEFVYRRFVHDRWMLGRLVAADELAEEMFRALPVVSEVHILVRSRNFDAGSATFVVSDRVYETLRPGVGP